MVIGSVKSPSDKKPEKIINSVKLNANFWTVKRWPILRSCNRLKNKLTTVFEQA